MLTLAILRCGPRGITRRRIPTTLSRQISIGKFQEPGGPNYQNKTINRVTAGIVTCFALVGLYKKWQRDREREELLQGTEYLPEDTNFHAKKLKFVRYKECVLSEDMVVSGTMKAVEEFEARKEDVFVVSFPKSGTTWLQEVVFLLLHPDHEESSKEIMEDRFPYLEHIYPGIKEIESRPGQRLIKSHLPIDLLPLSAFREKSKILYIYRNPKDVAVSYWHFARMLTYIDYRGTFEKFARLLMTDRAPYSPYFRHIHGFLNDSMDNKNLLVISYEDMKSDPAKTIRSIAKFLDVSVDEEAVKRIADRTSFEAMKKNPSTNYQHWDTFGLRNKRESQFMRKGEVGDYKNFFHPDFEKEYNGWIESGCRNTDLNFKYCE